MPGPLEVEKEDVDMDNAEKVDRLLGNIIDVKTQLHQWADESQQDDIYWQMHALLSAIYDDAYRLLKE